MDWLDLFAVQGTLKSLLQHHTSKASILRRSAFFTVQLSHPYMTTGETIALTRRTFVGKVMSLLFNMLSRLVITFLPRSKHLLISWLPSPSAVILEPPKIKSDTEINVYNRKQIWLWKNFTFNFMQLGHRYIHFSSVAQLCPTLCDPTDCTWGFAVHHQLLKSTQTHGHWIGDVIQPSHPLSSPSPPTFNLSQHQCLFKWVSSSHQVAKVLEFHLQHQSF